MQKILVEMPERTLEEVLSALYVRRLNYQLNGEPIPTCLEEAFQICQGSIPRTRCAA